MQKSIERIAGKRQRIQLAPGTCRSVHDRSAMLLSGASRARRNLEDAARRRDVISRAAPHVGAALAYALNPSSAPRQQVDDDQHDADNQHEMNQAAAEVQEKP